MCAPNQSSFSSKTVRRKHRFSPPVEIKFYFIILPPVAHPTANEKPSRAQFRMNFSGRNDVIH